MSIETSGARLDGDLVVFAHGSGSSRHSTRNRFVAGVLQEARFATLLFDLLKEEEERIDERTRELRFDIPFLAARLTGVVDWCRREESLKELALGLFGASTGAAAALSTAAERPREVRAVVSRGGRPDLATESALASVQAPTLLIVGSEDRAVIGMNERASARMTGERHIEIVSGASHLFEEPGTLEQVARLAERWFTRHLTSSPRE